MAADVSDTDDVGRARVIRILAAATFLVFFQAFMVAPLLPRLAVVFSVSAERVGMIVPAYLLPYGIATVCYGVLSDRIGRRPLILGSLVAFIVLTALTATATSLTQLLAWRLLTGIGASAIVPLSLALIGQAFPYEERGRPLGLLFGAMAGGAAFGSTVGALLVPIIGWRGLFIVVAACAAAVLVGLLPLRGRLGEATRGARPPIRAVVRSFGSLLGSLRGARTYSFVFLNAAFHSGVFTWLGVYLSRRFALGEQGIGLALLGYGVPGLFLGPAIGRLADRFGRRHLLPLGLAVGAVAALALAAPVGLVVAVLAVTVLSLGYDLTQPLFAGIVTTLDPTRPGQAMGLNVFALFTGFAVGSAAFGIALRSEFARALTLFGIAEAALAVLAVFVFASERRAGNRAATTAADEVADRG